MKVWRETMLGAALSIWLLGGWAGWAQATPRIATAGPVFSISFPKAKSAAPIDGRLLLLFSTDPSDEPRNQIGHEPTTQMVFGETVDGLKPDQPTTVTAGKSFGWPVQSLKDVKPGDYYVQALINRYETFHRADGSVIKLAPDRGEGQHWNLAPGNLYSTPIKLHIEPGKVQRFTLSMDQEIPPIAPKADTDFVKHISIKSELLSRFWGRPVYLGAHILLPAGFDEHPTARFPLMVFHGHFPDDISEFRTTPPDPRPETCLFRTLPLGGPTTRSSRRKRTRPISAGSRRTSPAYIVIEIEHDPNPYYDDSYAVNSANLGPYGDAINKELIPYIEKRFRGLGQGWARFTYGGSTGGWEAMATQVFYPDMYNGAFIACPDPIDFRAYTTIDLYKDKNAYFN